MSQEQSPATNGGSREQRIAAVAIMKALGMTFYSESAIDKVVALFPSAASETACIGGDKATAESIALKISARCDEYASGKRGVASNNAVGAVISAMDALYHDIKAFAASRLETTPSATPCSEDMVRKLNIWRDHWVEEFPTAAIVEFDRIVP